MIAKMNGWKVVLKKERSYHSYTYSTLCSIKYKINKRVYPKLKDSMLFFFAKRVDAEFFIGSYSGNLIKCSIVPCIAYDCIKPKYMGNVLEIEDFWRAKKNKHSTVQYSTFVPKGTWFAKSIIITK